MLKRFTLCDRANAYDYIVVGAGSAGCVMAVRLSESSRHQVLPIEAGPSDSNPWVRIPIGYHKLFSEPSVNWMLQGEAELGFNRRTTYQPRGKVLGGSSSINAMIYVRGHPRDYDLWRQMIAEKAADMMLAASEVEIARACVSHGQ